MAQLATLTLRVVGVRPAKLLVQCATPVVKLVRLFSPRAAGILCIGLAWIIPKLIRVRAV